MGTKVLFFAQSAQVRIPHYPRLDLFARWALDFADGQTVFFGIGAAIFIFFLTGRMASGKWAGLEEMFHAGIAILTALSGITVALVFMFTDPPAFEKLEGESRWMPAAVTLAITLRYCVQQIYKTFFKK